MGDIKKMKRDFRSRTKKPGQWPGHFGLPKDGARGRIRTTDTRIFSPLLYQLSYPGIL
jgi:hypothetical protein